MNIHALTHPTVASAAIILLKISELHLNMIHKISPFTIQVSQQLTQRKDLPEKILVAVSVEIPFFGDERMSVPPKFVRASSLAVSIPNQLTNIKVGNTFVKIYTRKERSTRM